MTKERLGNDRKRNYLKLDWSIDSLEERFKYLEDSGILKDLTDRRDSRFAAAQMNMVSTYIFRAKDVESGRKVDESYYVDDSSYYRSLKVSSTRDDIDNFESGDEMFFDTSHDDTDDMEDSEHGNVKHEYNEDSILDNSDFKEDSEPELGEDIESEYVEESSGIYKKDLDEHLDIYEENSHEYIRHIKSLFNPDNMDYTMLRKIIMTYKDAYKIGNELVKYEIQNVMTAVEKSLDGDDDNKVIELLMQDMTEREMSRVMGISRQSINKRIKKILRKTIKELKNTP